jgi:hypothetical protein
MARPARHRADPPPKPDVTVFSHPAPQSSGCCHQYPRPHLSHRVRFSNRDNNDEQVASCLDDAVQDNAPGKRKSCGVMKFLGSAHKCWVKFDAWL